MGLTGAGIRAGRAFVEIGAKDKLQGDLGRIRAKLNAFALSVGKIGLGMTAFAGALGVGIFGPAIKAASDFTETVNAFDQVFREQKDSVRAWADEFARSIGRSRNETMRGLTAFQGMFIGFGMARDEAAKWSMEMQRLSVDFASFWNISDEDAQRRFRAGLSGSGEVFDMFGVNIKQSALDMKLVEMGFKKTAQGATELQKTMARVSIIQETLSAKQQGVEGDALRTKKNFANQLKVLKGEYDNLKVAIGQGIIPIVTKLLNILNAGVISVTRFVEKNKWVATVAFLVTSAIGTLGVALIGIAGTIATISFLMGQFAAAWSVAAAVIAAVGLPIIVLIGGLGLLAAAFLGVGLVLFTLFDGWKWLNAVIKAFTGQISQATVATKAALASISETFNKTWQGIKDALSGGDIAMAGKIAILGLAVAIIDPLDKVTQGFRNTLNAIAEMVTSWVKGVVGSFYSLAKGALESLKALGKSLPFSGVVAAGLAGIEAGLGTITAASKAIVDGVGDAAMTPFNLAAGALNAANSGLKQGLEAQLEAARKLNNVPKPDPDNAEKYMAEKLGLDLSGSSRGTFSGAAAKVIAGGRDAMAIPKKQLKAAEEGNEELNKIRKALEKPGGFRWA